MTKEEANSIVCSAWEAQHYLGKDYVVSVDLTSKDKLSFYDIHIRIHKGSEEVFTQYWQTGDTVESFLDGFNARFNSIFECEA
jgi:hypothetical protein